MGIWWLKHLAALFKRKMTFHSGIRNWKRQAETAQKQSLRITIRLINDLNIKCERAPGGAARWDEKIPVSSAENRDVTGKGHFEVGIPAGGVLQGLLPSRKGKEPLSKPWERFEPDSNEQRGGGGRENPNSRRFFHRVFLFPLHSRRAGSSPAQPSEQPGRRELSLPCLGWNQVRFRVPPNPNLSGSP